jgi:hypothetical protein
LKFDDLSQREFAQRIKAMVYPNRLLELGGLLEILDFTQDESPKQIKKNQSMLSRYENISYGFHLKFSDQELAQSESLS